MPGDVSSHMVGIRVPAELQRMTMFRALTETALLITDLALDEVTDVQVAIDEIVTILIDAAATRSSIGCDLAFDDGRVGVCVTGVVTTRDAIDEQGFSWHVMRTLTESPTASLGVFDMGLGGYPVTVEFGRVPGALRRADR